VTLFNCDTNSWRSGLRPATVRPAVLRNGSPSLKQVLSTALISSACGAAQAALLTYEWSIDWQNLPDQIGVLSFDDEGDASARSFQWYLYFGIAPPPRLQGLPPGFGIDGGLRFDGSAVTGFNGCDDFFEGCNDSYATPSGWTRASFSLGAAGSATGWTYSYTGSDPASNCFGSAVSLLPPSCFDIDRGLTTFSAVALATPVPEPASWAQLAAGLLGLVLLTRRRTAPERDTSPVAP
jgi:hypothetical protein